MVQRGAKMKNTKQNNNQSGVRELNLHRFFYYHKSTSKERSDLAAVEPFPNNL